MRHFLNVSYPNKMIIDNLLSQKLFLVLNWKPCFILGEKVFIWRTVDPFVLVSLKRVIPDFVQYIFWKGTCKSSLSIRWYSRVWFNFCSNCVFHQFPIWFPSINITYKNLLKIQNLRPHSSSNESETLGRPSNLF